VAEREMAEWFRQIGARVHYAIVVTEKAALGDPSDPRSVLPDCLIELAKKGVFVFLLTAKYRHVAHHPPVRLQQVTLPTPDVDAFRNQLQDVGLRANHVVLLASSEDDPFFPLLLGLHDLTNSQRQELPPPLLIAPNDSAWAQDRLSFLPVGDAGDKSVKALEEAIGQLFFAERINLTEHAVAIRDGSILERYMLMRDIAAEHRKSGTNCLKRITSFTPEEAEDLFDPRSGAIFVRPDKWRQLCSSQSPRTSELTALIDYFQARLPDYWQDDRPCMRRVLYTPTKVLLRGEQYYVNMRNESPFARLNSIWTEAQEWRRICSSLVDWTPAPGEEWRLLLGFHDQLRSLALQLYLFVHSGPAAFPDFRAEFTKIWGDSDTGIHGLLQHAIRCYYGCLLRRFSEMRTSMTRLAAVIGACERPVSQLMDACSKQATNQRTSRTSQLVPSYGSLVRRWREADHPGENLLVASLAAETSHDDTNVHAVGIGWGGIELPLVFDYIAGVLLKESAQKRLIHVAQWSHYRGPEDKVEWYHFPLHTSDALNLGGARALLMDDNTLTGVTLEHLRDELLLLGARDVRMFVTRYSGERRFAQMQMKDHGAVDPEVLRDRIGGYLGETPFARSWSREEYRNPIGVFSLSRRRILECIHNNSTVELYQREGF
jgi:hypothetical protein